MGWTSSLWALVPIIAVVGYFVTKIIQSRGGNSSQVAKALEANAETNRALLAKLETIDTRLGAVEKTLNDIP